MKESGPVPTADTVPTAIAPAGAVPPPGTLAPAGTVPTPGTLAPAGTVPPPGTIPPADTVPTADAVQTACSDHVLPAIPVSAGALVFDHSGRLLVLKPTYKSGWTIPGGVMEADGETPWQACRREVREETSLDVTRGRLVCMDFRRPRAGTAGGIRYLFDCGRVPDSHVAAIEVQAEEISEYRFVPVAEALSLLRKPIRRRVRAVRTRAGKPRGRGIAYLEDGRPIVAVSPPDALAK